MEYKRVEHKRVKLKELLYREKNFAWANTRRDGMDTRNGTNCSCTH